MYIGTANLPFLKLYSSNVSASSITNPTPTTTAPTGNGVYDFPTSSKPYDQRFGNELVPSNQVALAFYGTRSAADNETFSGRITGWRQVSTLWVPVPLLALALTQGTSVGVASSDVVATEYFADTITASTAFTTAYEIISPVDNTIAMVKVDLAGCSKVQVDLAKGTNATCNVLAAGF